MGKTPSPPSWPAWLLFLLVVVGPPSAFVALLPTVTHNPFMAGGWLLAYEGVVGLGTAVTALLKKIWERRGDTWADASASRLEYGFRAFFAHYGHRYREFFYEMYRDLDMKGISIRGAFTLELEQVFVDVRLDPVVPEYASTDLFRLPIELQMGNPDFWDYLLLLNRHLVILGAPGSGKTTMLKHLGLSLACGRSPRSKERRRFPWKVPVFLSLRDYREMVSEHEESYDLLQAIGRQLATWQHAAIELTWMKRRLQQGQCLILLDGLDEIADLSQRQQMVAWVESQMHTYSKNGFVLTSRPLGYRVNPLEGVDILETQPFTLEKVTRFAHAWYTASEIKSTMRDSPGVRVRAQEGAEDLLRRLRETPALFAIAVNPLLLTMIADGAPVSWEVTWSACHPV